MGRYPVGIFPPIDYHTSTFWADPATGKGYIIIIGGAGYDNQASHHQTDVYILDLSHFAIVRLATSGTGPPGGTSIFKAELLDLDGQPAIRITRTVAGSIQLYKTEDRQITMPEGEDFTLRLRDLTWI